MSILFKEAYNLCNLCCDNILHSEKNEIIKKDIFSYYVFHLDINVQ